MLREATRKPNILWICTDQQRWDTLGCYGNQLVRTPNIDRLARRGMLFENAYCQSPICTPSRSSFLTGRYPRTTRCRQNGQSIPEDEVLVPRLLADAGYVCGLSGKLHISACDPTVAPITERRIDDGYAEFHWSHDHDPRWVENEYIQWLREQDLEYRTEAFRNSPYVQAGMPAEYHQTTWCAQKAIDFIGNMAHFEHPWLFSVNIFDPHHPFDPPEDYLNRYLDRLDDIPLPNYQAGELDNKPHFQRVDHEGAYGQSSHIFEASNPSDSNARSSYFSATEMTEEDHRMVRAAYWAMVDLIDEQVGRMLEALERAGQVENTLVIFTSDHGEMLGDHGIYLKGPYFYEPAVHVPMIVSWPGVIKEGRHSEALVELVDLAPTLLDAADLQQYPGMQGSSLWPMLTGESDSDHHHEDVYCEYYNAMPWHKEPAAQATMVRTGRYKLVAAHGLSTGELYDLEQDPRETRNLWDDPGYAAIKYEMFQRLCDRMAWTVDPLPEREATF